MPSRAEESHSTPPYFWFEQKYEDTRISEQQAMGWNNCGQGALWRRLLFVKVLKTQKVFSCHIFVEKKQWSRGSFREALSNTKTFFLFSCWGGGEKQTPMADVPARVVFMSVTLCCVRSSQSNQKGDHEGSIWPTNRTQGDLAWSSYWLVDYQFENHAWMEQDIFFFFFYNHTIRSRRLEFLFWLSRSCLWVHNKRATVTFDPYFSSTAQISDQLLNRNFSSSWIFRS